ncbi:MAG: ATP-binding protein [Actinomycetota bacterium]|nr:ATP-binding protein [Actinomycetota bacterium]
MFGIPQQRRLEQTLLLLRAGGLIAGSAALAQEGFTQRAFAAVLLTVLVSGSIAIAILLTRATTAPGLRRLGQAAFTFDALVIGGAVWAWGVQAAPLLLFLPVEGALRYRLRGGIGAATAVGLFFAVMTSDVARSTGQQINIAQFLFISALAFAIGALIGAIVDNWHERSEVIEQNSARLFEMDRLKDRFIAVTSHEIRGPLTAMITAVDTVRIRWEQIPAERRDHLLEMVYLQGHQLDRLVEDLMISAEVQSGGVTLHPRWEDLELVVKRAVDASASKRRSHLLEVFIDPVRAEIDPYRTSQILRNLVENAYKYTPDRTRVAVTAKAVNGGIQFEVADEGEGIPPEKRDQLFEAFTRIEEAAAGQEGLGLGLYVVSQLVAAMEGRIDLSSSTRGTTFSIFIPCKSMPLDQPHIGLVKDHGEEASG